MIATLGFETAVWQHTRRLMRVHVRHALATDGRQMPQIDDDGPQLVVAQCSLGARHAGWTNAIIKNPLQLPVGIALNLRRRERGNWRGDVIDERNTRVL